MTNAEYEKLKERLKNDPDRERILADIRRNDPCIGCSCNEAYKARHIADKVTQPMTVKSDPAVEYVKAMLVALLFGIKVESVLAPDHRSEEKQSETENAAIKNLMAYITKPQFSIEQFLKRKELETCGSIEDELEMIRDHSSNWVGNIFFSTCLATEQYLAQHQDTMS